MMKKNRFLHPYTVKESARAKRVTLRIRPHHGLEVVVPRGFDHSRLPAILEMRREWADEHLGRLAREGAHLPDRTLPEKVVLPAVQEEWTFTRVHCPGHEYRISCDGVYNMRIEGPDDSYEMIAPLYAHWLKQIAKFHFPCWLQKVREAYSLPRYNRVQVRIQKTRWGSCSSKGNINLNAKLLFLKPELVEYLFVHELCHLLHLNHSDAYWAEVAGRLPDYREREEGLRDAWKDIPGWVEGLS